MLETGFKMPPSQTPSVWGPVRCHQHTDFFPPAHSPIGQKRSLINFKHKVTTPANYTDGIGTGYTYHNKEICLHVKRLTNNFKINQSNQTCTDAVMKRMRGRGKKVVVFHPKTSINQVRMRSKASRRSSCHDFTIFQATVPSK